MTSRRSFLGFVASLPFFDWIPTSKKRIFGGNLKNVKFALCGTKESRNKLKDLYCSPEAMEDIRNWSVIEKDTRREIYSP